MPPKTKTDTAAPSSLLDLRAEADEAEAEAQRIAQENAEARALEASAFDRAAQLRSAELATRTQRSVIVNQRLVATAPDAETALQTEEQEARLELVAMLEAEPWYRAAVRLSAARKFAFGHRARIDGAATQVNGVQAASTYEMPPDPIDVASIVLGLIEDRAQAITIDSTRMFNNALARFVEGSASEVPVTLADAARLTGEVLPGTGDSHGMVDTLRAQHGYNPLSGDPIGWGAHLPGPSARDAEDEDRDLAPTKLPRGMFGRGRRSGRVGWQ